MGFGYKKIFRYKKSSLVREILIITSLLMVFMPLANILIGHASASTSGQLVEYLHKENSDANEKYNSMGLIPPEPSADTIGNSTVSFVQSNSAGAASVNFTSAPTQGDLLIAYVFDNASTAQTMSSSGWTAGVSCATGNGSSARAGRMFWKIAGSGESSTVTSANGSAIAVAEYSGVDTTTPNIGESAQANNSGVNTTPSLTPTAGKNALVVSGLGIRSSNRTYSSASVSGTNAAAASQRENPGTTNASSVIFDSLVSSTSGAYQGSATPSANAVGCGSIAVFQAAGPSTTNVNATPPTSFCESSTNTADNINQVSASSATTGNRCIATFISQPLVGPAGGTISLSTGDTASVTGQFWSSESSTTVTAALNAYIYRWSGSGTTLTSTDRIATLTCADPGTTATSCTPTAVTPANNVTFNAGDRMVVIISINVTALVASSTVSSYFDSTGRTAAFVKMSYTSYGYNSANKPALSGAQDDDFTTDSATTACSTGGVTYNTKWTCLQGTAANTAGAFNAASLASPAGDSTGWLWLRNQTTSTSASVSNFGTTPSNTFLYQTLPAGYQDGSVTTVLNSSAMHDAASSGTSPPDNHAGLVLWTSNTDYLELQVASIAPINDSGTATVKVQLYNSGVLQGSSDLNASTTGNGFSNIWLRITKTGNTYQAQYSTDGASFTPNGSVTHATAFSRVGLNAFTAIANPVTSYAGAFEWFEQSMTQPPQYTQSSYRWFGNADQADPPGSALAATNAAYTLTSAGQQFRLRQLIKPDQNINADSQNFSEQYANLSTFGSCSAIPSLNWLSLSGTSGSGTSGPNFASTAVDDSSNGGQTTWSNPGNVSADDSSSASTSLLGGQTSDYLKTSGYGFSIPSGVNISGISVDVKRYKNSIGFIQDSAVRIIKGGVIGATDRSNGTAWSTTPTYQTYGSSSDLWGQSWTPADINSGSFGFAISVLDGSTETANIDAIRITVYYYSDSTGPNLPGTGATDPGVPWVSPSNITALDSTYSTVNLASLSSSSYLKGTNFGYAIPLNANITGVSATVRGHSNLASDSSLTSVRLIKGGVIGSTNKFSTNNFSTVDGTFVFGSAADLWGDTWTPADINSSNFGVAIQATAGTTSDTINIDDIEVTVYYIVADPTDISYYDNPTPNSGDAITYHAGTDPTDSGTYTAQTYQESDNFGVSNNIAANTDGIWDLSLYDNGAPAGTTYCFRMVKADGSPLDTYTNYPMITTFSTVSGPTTDQLLRGGEFFSGGSKQSFFWAS